MLLTISLSFEFAHAASNPDRLYRKGEYKQAESLYEKLDLENPKDISYRYNKGCALYHLKDYKKAQEAFTSIYQRAVDNDMRFRAAYNLGNTAFMAGDMQSAVSFFKEALRMKPGSGDARNNLELALKKIKEEEEKKKQQQQQQNQQNKKEQENKQQNDQSGNNQQNDQQKNDKQQKGKNDTLKDQSGQKQQKDGNQQQQQQQQPQNLEGELKAVNPAQVDKQDKTGQKQQQANSPARAQAEALLGNIQEDRSRFHKNQPQQEDGSPKSGKYW